MEVYLFIGMARFTKRHELSGEPVFEKGSDGKFRLYRPEMLQQKVIASTDNRRPILEAGRIAVEEHS